MNRWEIGPTPLVGSIGLGTIQGDVGEAKTGKKKRSAETPAPAAEGWGWGWGK
jgi:hypothetical protein